MRNRTIVLFAVLLFAAVFSTGCGNVACNRICDWLEDCGFDDSDCVSDCVSDYWDGDWDCRASIRDFARCVDDKDCADGSRVCDDEAMDMGDECDDDFGTYYGVVPDPSDGAAAEQHCDYQCTIDSLFYE